MPSGLASYIIRRLLVVPFVLIVVSFFTFCLGRFAPSDYVELQAGPRAREATIERIKEERGLNDPVVEQYVDYMIDVMHGDFGTSVRYRLPVEDVVLPRLWISFQINFVVMLISWPIALIAGTWAGLRRGSWLDPFTIGLLLIPASIPVLVSTPLLQWFFAVKLGILPSGGWSEASYFGVELGIFSKQAILPILILTLPAIAGLARYMRSQVIEVMDADFVRTAQAKGLPGKSVVVRHVFRNALLPIVTLFGFELAALTAGSIFVETLLGIPGIGQYTFEAVNSRDYDGIMAVVILGCTIFVAAMLLIDVLYGFIDPRIREGGSLQ